MSSWEFSPLRPINFGQGDGNTDWDFPTSQPWANPSGNMTLLQLLARREAAKKKGGGSFTSALKDLGRGALNPVLWSFDKLMRPSYGIASAVQGGLQGDDNDFDVMDALKGFSAGFTGKNKIGFGEVLKDHGVLKNHSFLRGLAGFALDVGTDPLTYLTMGATGVAKGGAAGAVKAVSKEFASDLTESAARKLLKEQASAVQQLESLGKGFEKRAALGRMNIAELNARTSKGALTLGDEWTSQMSLARRAARSEMEEFDPRYLDLNWRVPFTSKKIGGTTGVRLPGVKVGELGIPVVSKTAQALGKAFKPGYGDKQGYQLALGGTHVGERLMDDYVKETQKRFGRTQAIDQDKALDAMHLFEDLGNETPAVIKQGDDYILNPERIAQARAAGLDDEGMEFVQAMHDMSRFYAKKDKAFGVKYDNLAEKGRFYVPHISKKTGESLRDVERNLLTQRGYLKKRSLDLSLKQIKQLVDSGDLRGMDIATNPYEIMVKHARSVSKQHADQSVVNYLRESHAVPRRIVDEQSLRDSEIARKGLSDKRESIEKALQNSTRFRAEYKKAQTALRKKTVKEYDAKIRDVKDRIKAHLNGEWTRTTQATVRRLSQYAQRLKEEKEAVLKSIDDGTHPALQKEEGRLVKAIETLEKEKAQVDVDLKRLDKAENKIRRGTANPLYDSAKHRTVENKNLRDEFGNKIAFPNEVADQIERLNVIMRANDETLQAFANGWRKWIGKWKILVTTVNVGSYGMRNTFSDFWNMWLAGVPPAQMVNYGGKAARLMKRAKDGDPDALAEIAKAYDQGVMSGLFAGDVQAVSDMLKHGGGKRALLDQKRLIKLGTKITQDINRNRENWGRLTHYMYRREKLGMNVADAASEVRAAHFDYEELTPFEQKTMKSIAPFYTWSRKNIPYQLKSLVAAPGRMAAFPKFANEMDAAAGGSENDLLPDYMKDGMYLKMPFGKEGKYMAPMIGVTDLMRLTNPQQMAAGMLSPAIKAPMEMLMNKSMLTGNEIKGSHERNAVSAFGAGLAGLIPGANAGRTERFVPGKGQVASEGASPYFSYLAGQTPITNMLVNQTSDVATARRDGDNTKPFFSWLTGFNVNTVDQDAQEYYAAIEFREQMEELIRKLRDENILPEAEKSKTSPNQKLIDTTLFNALRGG